MNPSHLLFTRDLFWNKVRHELLILHYEIKGQEEGQEDILEGIRTGETRRRRQGSVCVSVCVCVCVCVERERQRERARERKRD